MDLVFLCREVSPISCFVFLNLCHFTQDLLMHRCPVLHCVPLSTSSVNVFPTQMWPVSPESLPVLNVGQAAQPCISSAVNCSCKPSSSWTREHMLINWQMPRSGATITQCRKKPIVVAMSTTPAFEKKQQQNNLMLYLEKVSLNVKKALWRWSQFSLIAVSTKYRWNHFLPTCALLFQLNGIGTFLWSIHERQYRSR